MKLDARDLCEGSRVSDLLYNSCKNFINATTHEDSLPSKSVSLGDHIQQAGRWLGQLYTKACQGLTSTLVTAHHYNHYSDLNDDQCLEKLSTFYKAGDLDILVRSHNPMLQGLKVHCFHEMSGLWMSDQEAPYVLLLGFALGRRPLSLGHQYFYLNYLPNKNERFEGWAHIAHQYNIHRKDSKTDPLPYAPDHRRLRDIQDKSPFNTQKRP